MDNRVQKIQAQSNPSNAGNKHCQMFSTGLSSGAFGGLRQDRNIAWHHEFVAHMPATPVHHQERMSARGDLGGDFIEMQLHHGGLAARNHKAGPYTPLWTDRDENSDGLGSLILGGDRPASLAGPSVGDLGFLTDPGPHRPARPLLGGCAPTRARRSRSSSGKFF